MSPKPGSPLVRLLFLRSQWLPYWSGTSLGTRRIQLLRLLLRHISPGVPELCNSPLVTSLTGVIERMRSSMYD